MRDFLDERGEPLDTGLVLFFPGPDSYTGEDVLELHAHGGPVLCNLLIERICHLGARLARPGEFTERAFLNDKLDLTQAEAVADLIDAGSVAGARAARRSLRGDFSASVDALVGRVTELRTYVEASIDFPDEDVEFLDAPELHRRVAEIDSAFVALEAAAKQGCLLREGLHVVIAGRPNVGKSSLLNALAGYPAAIVSPISGTTRDLVREDLDVDGLPLHIVDTAGLREASDEVEQEGVRRTREQVQLADHALLVVEDGRETGRDLAVLLAELPRSLDYTIVINKIDLTGHAPGPAESDPRWVRVSALTGAGIEALRNRLREAAGFQPAGEGTVTARRRHLESIARARQHFELAREQLGQRAGELVAEELLQAQNALCEITGEFTSDDLLGRIFGAFCIGK